MGETEMPQRSSVTIERVDQLQARLKAKIEVLSGFGSEISRQRKLVDYYKKFDNDGTGYLTRAEFHTAMSSMNFIGCSMETSALFDRYDGDGNGRLVYKVFCSKLLGVAPDPEGDPILRGILDRVRQKALEQGGTTALRTMRCQLGQAGEVNERELREAFRSCGVLLDDKEVATIIKEFDRSEDGIVNIAQVLLALRLNLTTTRKALITMAFKGLSSGQNRVTLQDICDRYRTDAAMDGEQHYEQFSRSWDKQPGDSVSMEEFVEYYRDISSAVDDDESFEHFMRSGWSMDGEIDPGDEGIPSFKVRVSHADGKQSLEYIPLDYGISPYDDAAIKA